jgi:Sigma-70 region 2
MNGSNPKDTHPTVERVARESYGRLVAYLSSHTRDVASAEDALSNALVAALTAWPRDGMPQNPEAWVLTTAHHSLIDLMRHQQLALASEPTLLLLRDEPKEAISSAAFPDERLKLLFVCTNPGDRSDHAHAPYAPDRSWPECSAGCSCHPGLSDDEGSAECVPRRRSATAAFSSKSRYCVNAAAARRRAGSYLCRLRDRLGGHGGC